MKFIRLFSIIAILGVSAGCTISSPGVKLKAAIPGVQVEVDGGGGGHGVHCPPGQAKKGNC